MGNFVVSARKYRPVGFEEVIGQGHITTTLKNAIDNKQLAQALLFCGPRGVGKTTCARIVACLINEQNIDNPLLGNHTFNIYELDAASNNSVDDIRNLIDQVRYPPQQGKFKVYIIDEVHMLSNQAFNAFLKTLEEPPSYAIFILATTEKHKVIPTILSRCQIFDFNRIEVSDITGQLQKIADKERIQVEQEALELIAQKADGAMRDALSLFDLIVTFSGKNVTYKDTIDNLHILDYDYYFRMTDALLHEKAPDTMLIFDEILKKGFDAHNFIVGLCSHFRDLMVCKDTATIDLLTVSDNIKARYKEQSESTPLSFLLSALNIGNHCDVNYKTSKNQRLHVELALLKMAHLNSAISMASVSALGDSSKKNLDKADKVSQSSQELKSSTNSGLPAATTKEENSVKAEPVEPNALSEDDTQASRPSIRRTNKSKTIGIPTDLASAKNKLKKEKLAKEQAEEVQAVEESQKRAEKYSTEQFEEKWQMIADSCESKGQQHEALLLREPYDITDHVITVNLSNEALESTFERIRPSVLEQLRNALKNDHIQLRSKIVEYEKKNMLYTDKEKFEYLKKKYPALKNLQDKFGLDPEF